MFGDWSQRYIPFKLEQGPGTAVFSPRMRDADARQKCLLFPVTEVIDWQSDLLPVDRNAAVRSTPNAHAVHFGELCQ